MQCVQCIWVVASTFLIIIIYLFIFSSSLGLTDSAQLSLLQNDGSFVILCTLYLLLGLALLAMCFSIFRDALWHYPRLSSCFGIQNDYYCGKDGNSHPGMLYSKSHLSSWVYNETPSWQQNTSRETSLDNFPLEDIAVS